MSSLSIPTPSYLARSGNGAFPHVTADEVSQLVAEAPTIKTSLLIQTLWATGARITEVLELRADDLEVKSATVTIHRGKRRKKYSQEQPIPRSLAEQLKQFIKSNRRRGRIFTGDRRTAWVALRNLGDKVLGKKVTPHMFRHGKAYEMAKKGVHPLLISRALGHAQLSSSLQYYHPTDSDLRDALGAMN